MTTRALLHSLLVCHLPLSTTWLVCFLSLISFFLHGTSFSKYWSFNFAHTYTKRFLQNTLIKELKLGKGNVYITLHNHMGVTSSGQSSLKWFWWWRYVKNMMQPFVQHILMGCSDICKALSEVEFEVIFREVFEINSSQSWLHASRTDCSSDYS